MKKPTLYLIPGLGADGRLFSELKQHGLEFEVLEFIPPVKGESLREYAHRMAELIEPDRPFRLGGVSLGGMISSEIARIRKPEELLLISSVKNSREFPFYLQLLRYLPLHRLLSGKMAKRFGPENPFQMNPEHRTILRAMRHDADPEFVRWAIHAAISWRQPQSPPDCIHLHGTRDLLFPGLLVKNQIPIRKGSHVMVLDRAPEVLQALRRQAPNL